MDRINDLVNQFRLGYISLDEMWYQIDKLLDDFKPTLVSNNTRITTFKVNWQRSR